MSLTSHLADPQSPVRHFLYEHFPHTRDLVGACRASLDDVQTIRPDVDASVRPPFQTLGTALDYRLRYYFAVTPPHQFVAAKGALLLTKDGFLWRDSWTATVELPEAFRAGYGPPPKQAPSTPLICEFLKHLEETAASVRPVARRCERTEEERLASCCYVLALFEQVFRGGLNIRSPLYTLKPKAQLADLLELAAPSSVDDLCKLSWAFYEGFAGLFSKPATLNPTFDGSADIGGADADLIVDGCLVDIKATVDPRRSLAPALYQLLGYVLLDYTDRYGIQEVALYLARQGKPLRWPLKHLLCAMSGGEAAPLHEMRKRFREVVLSVDERLAG